MTEGTDDEASNHFNTQTDDSQGDGRSKQAKERPRNAGDGKQERAGSVITADSITPETRETKKTKDTREDGHRRETIATDEDTDTTIATDRATDETGTDRATDHHHNVAQHAIRPNTTQHSAKKPYASIAMKKDTLHRIARE